jgi:hypothetical protein
VTYPYAGPRGVTSGLWGMPGAGGISVGQPSRTVTLTRVAAGWNAFVDSVSTWWSSPNKANESPQPASEGRAAEGTGGARRMEGGGIGSERSGIGIGIAVDGGGATRVTELIADAPAAKSRMILVDDELVSVDGRQIAGLGRAAVRDLLLGAPGTDCILTIRRAGGCALVTVNLTRQEYTRPQSARLPQIPQDRTRERVGGFTWSLGPMSYSSHSRCAQAQGRIFVCAKCTCMRMHVSISAHVLSLRYRVIFHRTRAQARASPPPLPTPL